MNTPYRCTCGLIDVHAHCLPPAYRKALDAAGLATLDGGYPVPEWTPEKATAVMAENGIDTMMLSVSSPSVSFLPTREARVRLARTINEDIAQLRRDHPGSFGGFMTLPLPYVAESLAEIDYAFDELDLDGIVIETNSDGKYLGDPSLAPIFDRLNERKATIFLHPTAPACFSAVGLGRPAPLFEFPCDTARTVIDLVFSNTFKRCPDIKLILPHAGGVLPAIAHRIALLSPMPVMKPQPKASEEVIAEFKGLYYDLAMSANQPGFDVLRTLAPISQILVGTDFPFQPAANVARNIDSFRRLEGIDADEHEAIARNNALRLFPHFAARPAS
ncbi:MULTISPECIES: amidohydrolase family protein [Paraburkholderia]|uniref:6-methylsalicylate decarboxylase n=1 Tax=Paraburkholderia madseniana TaxID=2599607 RepID=A0A6N6W7C3_9BURK|nr:MULTISPECIES: amidohydrolase family protein [Paraburkholderia]KAE8756333.1 amidohydrolase family protein [Paraburkholderia madseniana]MCX4170089.1 amidohydrolase family protein [Paraburkholderia madseniana]MDQ6458101.1 amidohydrolase [Paraburkholderia madseniana]